MLKKKKSTDPKLTTKKLESAPREQVKEKQRETAKPFTAGSYDYHCKSRGWTRPHGLAPKSSEDPKFLVRLAQNNLVAKPNYELILNDLLSLHIPLSMNIHNIFSVEIFILWLQNAVANILTHIDYIM